MLKSIYQKYKDIIHDYFWRALQIFGKEGVTFFIFIISAKFLIPIDFGRYNYLMAVVFFLILFGDFGISTATSKFIAQYHETDKDRFKMVLFNSALVIATISLLVVFLTLLFGRAFLKENYTFVIYLLPLAFLAPMTSLFDGIYRGLKRFRELTVISLCIGIPFLFITVLLIKSMGLVGALLAQDLFYLLLLLALSAFYREWHFKLHKATMIEIAKYSLIIGITTLGYFLFTRINVILLGRLGYIVQIGYYEIINKMFAILLIPYTILSQVLAPRVTRLVARGETGELVAEYKKYLFFSAASASLLAAVVYFSFPLAAKLFLPGYDSQEIGKILSFLLIILVTQSASSVASVGFSTASGHAKLNMYFLMVFGVLNVILTTIFINLFGFWGVIYSTVLIKASSDIGFMYTYYRYVSKQG